MWDLTIHFPGGPTSLLAHCLVCGSDTIYNSSSLPLADIILFGFSISSFPSRFLKCVCYGEVSTPLYKECFVPLSNWRGISQSTSPEGPASLLAHRPVSGSDTISNDLSPPLAYIILFGLSLPSLPSRFLKCICYGEVSTLLQGMLRSPLQPTWDLTIHLPWESSIFASTPSSV